MALAYQSAIARNAGTVTPIAVGKDGVLVAGPKVPLQDRQPDFVTFAVTAMRDYADEAERSKRANDAAAPAPVRTVRGLQQLAARFKLFA
jgi:hypothetical protein